MRGLLAGLGLLLVILQWPLWLGEGSWSDVRELHGEVAAQRAANERLEQQNQALEAEVQDLRTGTDAVEERARRDLGMIREGEQFFFVVGEEDAISPLPEVLPDAADTHTPSAADTPTQEREPATDTLPPEDPFDG